MNAHTNPFFSVFADCMQASPDDQYMIIMDESTQSFLPDIDEALSSLSLKGVNLVIPIAAQKRICDLSKSNGYNIDSQLPRALRQALFESTIILNITSGDPSLAAFRRSIVHQSRHPESRFAHVPGISPQVLTSVAASPIDLIAGYCELFAWLIGNSEKAALLSYDHHGTCYSFHMTLGGWSNEPMMSPGRILKGSWGNIPPGETFTCPEADTAHGNVCLNGSGLGVTIDAGQEIILNINDGRLVGWKDCGNANLKSRFDALELAATTDLDSKWNCIAELGIGLNPAIQSLSGNPLFDEKALGTVHVAIGDNSGFGKGIASRRHNDLVIRTPTLLLDGIEVIHRGTINMQSLQDLRMNFRPSNVAFNVLVLLLAVGPLWRPARD